MIIDIALAFFAMVAAIWGTLVGGPKEASGPTDASPTDPPAVGSDTPRWATRWAARLNARRKALSISAKLAVAVAFIVFAIALPKAYYDQSDKEFTQAALAASLLLPPRAFKEFDAEIKQAALKAKIIPASNDHVSCLHTDSGITCDFNGDRSAGAAVLVLDRVDVAQMYKAQVERKVVADLLPTETLVEWYMRGANAKFLEKALAHQTSAEDLEGDEFRNKVGLLGMHAFSRANCFYPEDYNWDDTTGVRIRDDADRLGSMVLTPSELPKVPKSDLALFADLENAWLRKIPRTNSCPAAPTSPAASGVAR